jgi:hypothetical protein
MISGENKEWLRDSFRNWQNLSDMYVGACCTAFVEKYPENAKH